MIMSQCAIVACATDASDSAIDAWHSSRYASELYSVRSSIALRTGRFSRPKAANCARREGHASWEEAGGARGQEGATAPGEEG